MGTLEGSMQRLPAGASGTRTASPVRTRERQVASGRGLRGDWDAAPVNSRRTASQNLTPCRPSAKPQTGKALEDAVPERRARLGGVEVEGGVVVPWLYKVAARSLYISINF